MISTNDPAAWTSASFASEDDYIVPITPDDRATIVAAIHRLRDAGRLAVPVETLTKDEFAFGALSAKLERAYEDVRSGRGFTIMRRLPLDDQLTLDEFRAAVWGIGLHFGGSMLSQNASGELITEVIDATANDPTPRMYRSNVELRLHTDITDMLSLACWFGARTGGRSTIGSGIAIHDEIARRDPHALELELLYRGYQYHRLGEEADGEEIFTPYRVPIFANVDGQISVHYQRTGIAAGHLASGVPLTDEDIAALDLFDEVGAHAGVPALVRSRPRRYARDQQLHRDARAGRVHELLRARTHPALHPALARGRAVPPRAARIRAFFRSRRAAATGQEMHV